MPSPRYNPSYIEGTLEPTLPNFFKTLLRLLSFGSFFGFFSNITVPNTPFARSATFSPILTPTTLNHYIY